MIRAWSWICCGDEVSPPISRKELRHHDEKKSVNAEIEFHTCPIAMVPISHKMQNKHLLFGALLTWIDLDLNGKPEGMKI